MRSKMRASPSALCKGTKRLFPIAEAVGKETWYMVRTKQGVIGWVSIGRHREHADQEIKIKTGSSIWPRSFHWPHI
jgi:hypothetical protein